MRLLLISDSHGNKKGIDFLFKNYQFDYLFHMGDGIGDLGSYANLDNVISVCGNCDFFSSESDEKIITIESNKILVTHGHKYNVKYGLGKLISRGHEIGAKFIFYGHTHNANYMEIDNMYVINPGAFQKGKCVMLIIDDGISIENIQIER